MEDNQVLRIITWNVQAGTIEEKYHYLEKYEPDIVVLQEVAKPKRSTDHCLWSGDNPRKGIAVIASGEYRALPYPLHPDAPGYFLPVEIEGPLSLHVMAVWTHKRHNYVESVGDIITLYKDFLKKSLTIVAGDFNSNTIWDNLHRNYCHSKMVNDFEKEFNLVSSYHTKYGVNHGAEQHPTIFWLRNPNKGYHIDYCFVPKDSSIRNVVVGNYEEWKTLSDHRPLIVDLALGLHKPRL